ncbi:MAG: hypothetical protein HY343_10400 [Lentisphaerae bacterium]|nr:hypothetical protein [Lentisphaerota bacterium]
MISCTEFIPAYSELFKFLETKGGPKAVEDFWKYLSDRFLGNLKGLVEKNGLRGCWLYWSHTLNEEAADFTMELDEKKGWFRIVLHHCPSKGRLLGYKHFDAYPDYCRHCDVLYRRVLEPLGLTVENDLRDCDRARCSVTVRAKK